MIESRAKRVGRVLLRVLLRTLLVIFSSAIVLFVGLCLICNLVFNGPSPTARNVLTMSMLESSAMKWVPAVFIGEDVVQQIQHVDSVPLEEDVSDTSQIKIDMNINSGVSDEWEDYPDGIRIETVQGDHYVAHVMLIRDPSSVYIATSSQRFSSSTPGMRVDKAMAKEGSIATINGGAFNDDGTLGSYVGSEPMGLTISQGKVVWDDGSSYMGFAGFTEDNILVVANKMTASQAKEMKIRDGVCFGPVLIMNGVINDKSFSSNSGYNPRTAIGQRGDGAVIFVCVDGRQAGSLGATYADLIDIMVEYGAVNACNLDGGASSTMLYKDTYGRYGEAGETVLVNSPAILQQALRKMPTFFMVKPADSEE